MTEIILYVEIDLLCAVFMAVMLMNLWKTRLGASEDAFFFRGILFCWIILLTDILAKILNGVSGSFVHWFLYVDNAVYFLCTGALAFCCLLYVDYTISERKREVDGRRLMYSVPAVALGVLSLISIRTGSLFYIDANNCYQRGELHVVQEIIICLYFVVSLAYACAMYITSKNIIKRSLCTNMIAFIYVPFVGMILQMFFPSLLLIWPASCIGLFTVFTNLQNSRITMDALTGLNNHTRLMRYTVDRCEKLKDEDYLTCTVVDIDNFKSINDRYGHGAGDEVIIEIADMIKKSVGPVGGSNFLARYSGNAFVIITLADRVFTDDIVRNLQTNLEELNDSNKNNFQISISIGTSVFDRDEMNADTFITAADNDMYMNKQSGKF